ncbi:hypothetical protein GNI_033290 [Gregarina niphandrodes]|uniref:Uncharacterized protein n=1 Tax=Gregarina niphandrodes TaxID=110365 RepID=A0A023BAU8_GRENI|nr:hypothetical protein GNI_033290 [Gregarina niphandrodes]EZG78679.1 hypothetical protein GNI_033290 [Gregarina niphandrodes]|eukprot:XP_011129210.1 hypothetical protein GNI_033290 [Gregarina niphandrodes]
MVESSSFDAAELEEMLAEAHDKQERLKSYNNRLEEELRMVKEREERLKEFEKLLEEDQRRMIDFRLKYNIKKRELDNQEIVLDKEKEKLLSQKKLATEQLDKVEQQRTKLEMENKAAEANLKRLEEKEEQLLLSIKTTRDKKRVPVQQALYAQLQQAQPSSAPTWNAVGLSTSLTASPMPVNSSMTPVPAVAPYGSTGVDQFALRHAFSTPQLPYVAQQTCMTPADKAHMAVTSMMQSPPHM